MGIEKSKFSDIKLGIVCPMANEERSAVRFVNEVLDQCAAYDFAAVTFFAILDRVNRDHTRELLDEMKQDRRQLQVVWAPENKCAVDAYVRGYREALSVGCDLHKGRSLVLHANISQLRHLRR